MSVGGGTFINDMLKRCGLRNIFADKIRYPQVTINELTTGHCELLLPPSEPYPFRDNHVQELQLLLPRIKILLVDGEMFSWYGSRLLHAPAYFNQLLNQFLPIK